MCMHACAAACQREPLPTLLRVHPRVQATCLSGGDERRVSLAVLPVHIQMRALGQRYDDVHVTLVTRNQQPDLRWQETQEDVLEEKGNKHKGKNTSKVKGKTIQLRHSVFIFLFKLLKMFITQGKVWLFLVLCENSSVYVPLFPLSM